MAAVATNPTTTPPPVNTTRNQDATPLFKSAIPFLHSRKKLPPACVDLAELQDMTEHILTTDAGNLFQFNRNNNTMHRDDQADAWATADGTVQMVEYLMRGHAARVPGTLWNGWTTSPHVDNNSSSSSDPLETLDVMDKLLARMWDEGNFYMTTRKRHLSQMAWEGDVLGDDSESGEGHSHSSVKSDWREFAREDTIVNDEDDGKDGWRAADSESSSTGAAAEGEGGGAEGDSDDTTEDYAMPGPSVDMYDIYLDTIASAAAQVPAQDATPLLTARNAFQTFEIILYRHGLDGGDEHNDNRHTMPTQISYNAVMRTAANLPFDDPTAEVYRDWALMSAFAAHDALTHSALERNSSTYAYLLQVVAKYMPASPSRGNIARGLWKLAKTNGVYNDQVQAALLAANEISNSPDHDEWLDENIRGKDWRTDAPHRWRRRVKKYRMVPKQTTY